MSQLHVTQDGRCIYCGTQLSLCEVCELYFPSTRTDNTICSPKCRKRKSREAQKEKLRLQL